MAIYVSSRVTIKEDEYVEFLKNSCHYSLDEAETRRWEVEYQINQRCSPILMKPNTSGTIMFKSVLQRQEIKRYANNRNELIRFIKRRRGSRGDTQWKIGYHVSNSGDVFILSMEFYNPFSESSINERMKDIITETINDYLRKNLLLAS